jgi:hypothetical protein
LLKTLDTQSARVTGKTGQRREIASPDADEATEALQNANLLPTKLDISTHARMTEI